MRILALLFLCASACFGQMPMGGVTGSGTSAGPAVSQSNGGINNNATTRTAVLSSPVGAGATIVVFCGVNHLTTCTVGDTLNGAFGAAAGSETNPNGALGYIYIFQNSAAGSSDTITCTAAASGNTACLPAALTGVHISSLDQLTGSVFTIATATPASPNVTTTSANEVILGFFGANNATETITAGAGYTLFTNGSQGGSQRSFGAEYQVVSSTGTYNAGATFSGSSQGITIIATFK